MNEAEKHWNQPIPASFIDLAHYDVTLTIFAYFDLIQPYPEIEFIVANLCD